MQNTEPDVSDPVGEIQDQMVAASWARLSKRFDSIERKLDLFAECLGRQAAQEQLRRVTFGDDSEVGGDDGRS